MLRAVCNGVVLAETPRTVRVEGTDYFPPESIRREYFADSPTRTLCFWKGMARYYNVHAGGEILPDVAWHYPRPSPLARGIKNYVAFSGPVRIEGEPEGPPRGVFGWLRRQRA